MHEESNRNLPVLVEPSRGFIEPSRPDPDPWFSRADAPRQDEATVPLAHYLWILKRHRWKILSFVAASLIATLVVSSRLQPVYEATATIDIDRQMPTGVIGQEAMRSPMYDADQFLATQIKLIQSDSV
ncbi:MAG: Wzz/FepE/Etk N-terminal domain-containing protein, partial [Bryobacteraceae bacterium]